MMARFFHGMLAIALLLAGSMLFAQAPSRSGNPSIPMPKPQFKRFGCQGDNIFQENFNGQDTLPSGWLGLDFDGGTPRPQIQFLTPTGGWQVWIDPKDSTSGNLSLVSPSWYDDANLTSNDWLISPQVTDLPLNTCFSWVAYSQDIDYPESYEVRISTSGTDTADFLANDPLLIVEAEDADFSYYSLDLSSYAGQDIHVAFRHTSTDAFMLVLDDVRMDEVEQLDLAVFELETAEIDSGDEVIIAGAFINRGLDTVEVDSGQLVFGYEVGGAIFYDTLERALNLLPNDTIQFVHDTAWIAPDQGIFQFKIFHEAIPGDQDISNDTLTISIGVETVIIGINELNEPGWTVGPNPTQDKINIRWEAPTSQAGMLLISDLTGRYIMPPKSIRSGTEKTILSLSSLPAGLYLLQFVGENGQRQTQRIRVER